jgi:hypothetical protein
MGSGHHGGRLRRGQRSRRIKRCVRRSGAVTPGLWWTGFFFLPRFTRRRQRRDRPSKPLLSVPAHGRATCALRLSGSPDGGRRVSNPFPAGHRPRPEHRKNLKNVTNHPPEILASMSTPRRCVVCGGSMEGRRPQARTCSASCRREASRIRAILAGESAGPYATLADLASRRTNRAKRPYVAAGSAP